MTLRLPLRGSALAAAAAAAAVLLAGCSSLDRGSVPIVDHSEYSQASGGERYVPGSARDSGRVHTVAPGDTLYNISVRYGLDARELAQLNAISDPTQLRLGQVLHLPESVREPRELAPSSSVRVSRVTQAAPVSNATVVQMPTDEPAQTPTLTNTPSAPKPAEAEAKASQPAAAEKPSASQKLAPVVPGTRLLWPARGKVLSDYAQNGKGLDIGGTIGSVVVAAADGQVLFVGDGVKGYGQLVIIKHTPTIVTAYGHNSKVVVKLNDRVKAGQKIAEMGDTDASEPMLRFEVRDKGKPVDPMKFLPPQRK